MLGLRHPARLLPALLFKVMWKALWLALVAVPAAAAGDMDPDVQGVGVSCSLAAIIVAVIPWRQAWQRYLTGPGEPWH